MSTSITDIALSRVNAASKKEKKRKLDIVKTLQKRRFMTQFEPWENFISLESLADGSVKTETFKNLTEYFRGLNSNKLNLTT